MSAIVAFVGCGSSAALTTTTTTSSISSPSTTAPTVVVVTTVTAAPPVATTLHHSAGTTEAPVVAAAPSAPACPNGTYANSSGNTVCSPNASASGPPAGATAQCSDGTYSMSQHRSGTCSGHGGVQRWL